MYILLVSDSPGPGCHHAMDVGIIMDRSGSVGSADFLKSKSFVKTLVHRFQISFHGTRVGIIAYQSNSHLAVKFSDANSQNPAAMTTIIDNIAYTGGGTRTDIALEMANTGLFSSAGGDRTDKPNVLVVITDGKTNSGSKAYQTVLAPLIVSVVRVYVVIVWVYAYRLSVARLRKKIIQDDRLRKTQFNNEPVCLFFALHSSYWSTRKRGWPICDQFWCRIWLVECSASDYRWRKATKGKTKWLKRTPFFFFFFSLSLPVLQKSTVDFKLVLLSSGVQR